MPWRQGAGVRLDRRRRVPRPADHHGRRGDRGQSVPVVPDLDGLAAGQVAGVRGAADHGRGLGHHLRVRGRPLRGEPAGHHAVRDRCRPTLGDRGDPFPPRRAVREVGRGAAQGEPADPLRMLAGQVHADHAAQRQPAPGHPVQAERVQQRDDVTGQVGHPVRPRRHRRAAVPAVVEAQHPEPFAQRLDLRSPHVQRRARASRTAPAPVRRPGRRRRGAAPPRWS